LPLRALPPPRPQQCTPRGVWRYGKGRLRRVSPIRSQPAFVDTNPLSEEEELTMAKSRPPYPEEFRRRLVELVRSGPTPEELTEKFEPTAQSIRNCVAQADRRRRSACGRSDDRAAFFYPSVVLYAWTRRIGGWARIRASRPNAIRISSRLDATPPLRLGSFSPINYERRQIAS